MKIVAIAAVLLSTADGSRALAVEPVGRPVEVRHAADGTRLAYLDGPTWYAIAGSFSSRKAAEDRARALGGDWYAQKSDICENFAPGLWLTAAGFYSRDRADAYARRVVGYAKQCL